MCCQIPCRVPVRSSDQAITHSHRSHDRIIISHTCMHLPQLATLHSAALSCSHPSVHCTGTLCPAPSIKVLKRARTHTHQRKRSDLMTPYLPKCTPTLLCRLRPWIQTTPFSPESPPEISSQGRLLSRPNHHTCRHPLHNGAAGVQQQSATAGGSRGVRNSIRIILEELTQSHAGYDCA